MTAVALRHSAYLTARSLRTLWRQPAYAALTLVQPVIWLLLFGALFKSVVHTPGFDPRAGSYLEYITPGVIVMTALFSSGWAGTVYIEDMERGVMDRLLASPVRRGAIMVGTLAYQSVTTVVQTLTVLLIAYLAGARFGGGLDGIAVTVAAAHGSYLEFITPGIVVMTALFSSGWAGTVYIEDMNRGIMDRLLASPVRRGAMMIGTLAYQALTTVLQTLVVIGIALAVGARFPGGVTGVVVTLVAAALISVIVASLSNALALLLRAQEALIGISQFIVLPLQFLSAAIMDVNLAPQWVQDIARYNPVNWAVAASREALLASPDWSVVWSRLGFLAAFAAVMAWLATRAFGSYQRSL